MSRRYQTKNTDKNEKNIVESLRKIPGVTVITGMDDILVGYKGANYWLEIKSPSEVDKNGMPYKQTSATRKKTYEKQKKIYDEFTGSYDFVTNLDQILKIIGIIK